MLRQRHSSVLRAAPSNGARTRVPSLSALPLAELTFNGDFVPDADQSTPIQLGTITYTNGTSNGPTLIFGATLTFSLGGVTLGSDTVTITSTTNQSSGLDLTAAQAQLDADYINICGPSSNINSSF